MKPDLLLRGATVVDPLNGTCEKADVAVQDGLIAEVAKDLGGTVAAETLDVGGLVLQPGIIDSHLHLGGEPRSHRMVAKAGVTTCLDMCGPLEGILADAAAAGCGLNIGILDAILPGVNIPGRNPGRAEISDFIEKTMAAGAMGIKLLGGHYPLTPEASALMVETAAETSTYMAWHAGTTENGSNLNGLKETVDLCAGNPLHLPHLNAYCRGAVKNVMEECLEAAELLEKHPEFITESYLSARNGCPMQVDGCGNPVSRIVTSNLLRNGFTPDRDGMYRAIRAGLLAVIAPKDDVLGLFTGEEGIACHERAGGACYGSFDGVNPFLSRVFFATARRRDGTFLVDGIGTDGGAIPRNVILEAGISIVRTAGLSLLEFAAKSSLLPARMMKLANKGHLSPGADADITVYDPVAQKAVHSFAAGRAVLRNGTVTGGRDRIICSERGAQAVSSRGLTPIVVPDGIPSMERKNFHSIPVPLSR